MVVEFISDYSRFAVEPFKVAYSTFPYLTAISGLAICIFAPPTFSPIGKPIPLYAFQGVNYIYKKFPLAMHAPKLISCKDREALSRLTNEIIIRFANQPENSNIPIFFSDSTKDKIRELRLFPSASEQGQRLREEFSERILRGEYFDEKIGYCWKWVKCDRKPAKLDLLNIFPLCLGIIQAGFAHKNYPMEKGVTGSLAAVAATVNIIYFGFFALIQGLYLLGSYLYNTEQDGKEVSVLLCRTMIVGFFIAALVGWYFPLFVFDQKLIMNKVPLFPHFVSAISAASAWTVGCTAFVASTRFTKGAQVILFAGYVGAYVKLWNRYTHALHK